jgi:hypothetical protein
MKLLRYILIGAFFISGCRYFTNHEPERWNVEKFQAAVTAAMNGSAQYNDSLHNLFDLNTSSTDASNMVHIDSTFINKTKYYTLLIEYPNPLYNRFAVYDTSFRLLLLDKSLNGNLSQKFTGNDLMSFVAVTEKFRAKDSIKLERINLYMLRNSTVTKTMSTFISFDDGKSQLTQAIDNIDGTTINTSYSCQPSKLLALSGDSYAVDLSSGKSRSANSELDIKVLQLIDAYAKPYSPNQLYNKQLENVAKKEDTTAGAPSASEGLVDKKMGFYMNLTSQAWRLQKDVYITQYLNKPHKGFLYLNEAQGTSISVIELFYGESSEGFINYPLSQEVKKNYTVKFTDKILVQRNYIRFFEISCSTRKFLVILNAPRLSYDAHMNEYQDMVSSFTIDCQ